MIILVIVVAVVLLAVRVLETPLLHADSTDLCVDFVISRCGAAVLDSLPLIIMIIYRIFNDHLTDIRRITASHSSTPIVREGMSEENTSIDLIRVYLVSHQKRSIEYTSLVGRLHRTSSLHTQHPYPLYRRNDCFRLCLFRGDSCIALAQLVLHGKWRYCGPAVGNETSAPFKLFNPPDVFSTVVLGTPEPIQTSIPLVLKAP
jgi:hypothetical protein